MNLELKIELWPIDKVRPYERNPREIPQRAIDKVGSSLKEFGWRQPIVVDQAGVIIVGNVRYLAAREQGLDQVPVHIAAGLTPQQAQAYRLMDNRSHEETDWDLNLLQLEMRELHALEFDLKFTGFEPREIDEFLVTGDRSEDDAANQAPPPPAKPVSRTGDLWRCGPHQVLHGATKPEMLLEPWPTCDRN
jgi:ParB-like chromosome segregation protein Spo0J